MKILLDTQIFLWLLSGDGRLSKKAGKIFLCKDNDLYFSVVSLWEISIKISLGKLKLADNWMAVIEDEMAINLIKLLQIRKWHCYKIVDLPLHHRDPFDRMLIAQAMIENMSILTCDDQFYDYDIKSIC